MIGSRSSNRRSIAGRLRIAIAGASAIALVVAFVAFSAGWSQFVVRLRTGEISRRVTALAAAEKTADQFSASDEVRTSLFRVEAGLLGATLLVTDEAGAVLRSSDESLTPRSLDLTRMGNADSAGVRAATIGAPGGDPLLVVAAPVGDGRQMVAVQRLSEVRDAQAGVLALAAAALALALIVAWFAGGWMARRLTAPLVRLEAGAERVAAGEFGTQVAEEGDAETVSLARSFNRMSRRVAQAYDAQQAFVGDVSHEIRTPITSISGFAGALMDGTITEPESQARALKAIREEARRIQEMSDTLLSLSQLDAGVVELKRVPVDVSTLTEALRSRFGGAAAAKGLAFDVDLAAGGALIGDSERVLQAASALVANAIGHAPDAGTVRVSAAHAPGRWRLIVEDNGPGVPPEKRETVFTRFARLDESRSSSSGGAGLGLTICARLADLMGGRVWVDDSELGGARFVLELPVEA